VPILPTSVTSKVEEDAGKLGLRINIETKLMAAIKCGTGRFVITGNRDISEVDKFCCNGSVISKDSSCDKEFWTRLGKASSAIGRLNMRRRNISLQTNQS